MGQETEFKFALTQSEYNVILSSFNPGLSKSTTYWNVYYDTPHLDLQKSGYTFRISLVEDGQGSFCEMRTTFKGKKQKLDYGLHSCEEVEQVILKTLSKDDFFKNYTLLFPNDAEPWNKIKHIANGHPHLCVIGGIKVHRTKYPHSSFVIELDKVSFSDNIYDYELEVETNFPELAYPQISQFLTNHNIPIKPSEAGKQQRFRIYKENHDTYSLFTW